MVDSGNIAWVITATALVMLMTPALGFFYGGLVRKKNLVSTIVQCFVIFAVISIIWALWGYMLVFGNSVNGVIGWSPNLLGMGDLDIHTVNTALAPQIPQLLQFAFQLKVRSNHTSLNHWSLRRKIQIQVTAYLHGTMVYTNLLPHSHVGVESKRLASQLGRH